MNFETIQASWIQNKVCKILKAKMIKFEVYDQTKNQTNYRKIAESMDEKVFDAEICLFDLDPTVKAEDLTKVDVDVKLEMGKIRLVFLMKFVNDFLAFIEPFSDTRELVAEQAGIAYEEAEKRLRKAYANKTRAKLNVRDSDDTHCVFTKMNLRRICTFKFCFPVSLHRYSQEPKMKIIFGML